MGLVQQTEKIVSHTLPQQQPARKQPTTSPVRRGEKIEIIEDIIPIYDTTVSVKSDKAPKSVKLVPENAPIDFEYKDGRINFTVPKIDCWQMTEIKY